MQYFTNPAESRSVTLSASRRASETSPLAITPAIAYHILHELFAGDTTMDTAIKTAFLERWRKYFPGADLPIVFYYTDNPDAALAAAPDRGWRCLFADLKAVRKGKSIRFDASTIPCTGGRRYSGFATTLRPNFRYFLSCGIEGEMEGERYKRTPELVDEFLKQQQPYKAPAKYLVFKRFDKLDLADDPFAVIFFAAPDVLSGLYVLVNFDESERDGVIAPMGSGCSSIIQQAVLESQRDRPRAVLGMFDVSARPYVPSDVLTMTVVWRKFVAMVGQMDESFLTTKSWGKIRRRLE